MSIAGRAVRGAAWNLVAGVGSRVVTLIGTLILTRFIAPEDFGEVSAAQICVFTAMALTHAQLGHYIIARRAPPEVCFQAFVYHVGLGAIALGVVALLGPRLAPALDAPGMTRYLPGFIVSALLERISYIPERVLVRDLEFRTVAVARGSGEILFTAVALALAPRFGAMAIVIANLIRYAFLLVAFVGKADRKHWFVPVRLSLQAAKDMFGYGLQLACGAFADYASKRWDNLLVSRFFGPATMGAYSLAYNLATVPNTNVAEHIGDVLMPSFVRMDPAERIRSLYRSAAIMSLLIMPLAVGLGAIAPTLVGTLFDERWSAVAPLLIVLSLLSMEGPVGWPLVAFVQAQQRPRTFLIANFIKLGALLALVATVGRLGPSWACVAVVTAFGIFVVIMLLSVRRAEGVSPLRYLAGVLPPVLSCVPMIVAVVGVRWLLAGAGVHGGWRALAIEIVTGAVVYVAAALVVARRTSRDVIQLLTNALRRGGRA